jgi:hypothetical protein
MIFLHGELLQMALKILAPSAPSLEGREGREGLICGTLYSQATWSLESYLSIKIPK